jgi:hypothetical protein
MTLASTPRQDHWLSDIVIFSGLQGIVLQGGASVLTNTHIYNGGVSSRGRVLH